MEYVKLVAREIESPVPENGQAPNHKIKWGVEE